MNRSDWQEEWKRKLSDPDPEYRSAPFWAFNSRMEEDNLRFQIREMKRAGMGGFFVHSREGLETPYLSEEWMDAVEISMDEARKQGLEVWIYDEDKWPSGCAGGLVSDRDRQRFSSKGLTLEVLSEKAAKALELAGKLAEGTEYEDGKILGVYYAVTRDGRILQMHRRVEAGRGSGDGCMDADQNVSAYGIVSAHEGAPVPGEVPSDRGRERCCVLVLRREISAVSEWYNGYAPSDNLNPEAVREFLNLTHEEYKKRFAGEFGRNVKGFFTDEPNCCDFYSIFTKGRPWLTWTDDLPEYFCGKRGYDPMDQLPYLFFEGEGAAGIRHDFWWTVAERFQESYMKQLYEWCDENGVELTGHMLYENDLGYQARVCGSAMAQYKYLHRPGVDILGEQTKEYLTVKQCTSVARQYGRKHTITETYGCTGWEFDFEGQKWLGDWQFVMGIDRRCQHLAQYSITGCRKRDYPPVFSYQTTWWKYNELLEKYFGRLSACMGQSRVVREVLVLHPMSSLWAACGSSEQEDLDHIEMNMGWLDDHITGLNRRGEEYNRLAKLLLAAHVDFDFGDEILLSQDGAADGNTLRMAQCSYGIVAVPRITSMLRSTWKLLEEFARGGGRLILTAPLPSMLEGRERPELAEALASLPGVTVAASHEELARCLKHLLNQPVAVWSRDGQEDGSVLTSWRKTENGYLLLAVNNDRSSAHTDVIELPVAGEVTAYDPWTDTYETVPVECLCADSSNCRRTAGLTEADSNGVNPNKEQMDTDGKMRFQASFHPAESRIYFINTAAKPQTGRVEFPYVHPHYADPVFAAPGPAADVRRTMENVLTLDVCSYALNGAHFSEPMQVWQAQREIRERLGMQQVYYNGAPQRYFWLKQPSPMDGTPFALSFAFETETVLPKCQVVIEKPEQYEVFLNGEPCRMTEGYFMDRDMKRFALPVMGPGTQQLVIRGFYGQAVELEDIYIIGDFAVNADRHLVKESGKLHFGDWCFQGYYHYPGSMIYEFELPGRETGEKRYLLKLGDYRGTLAVIRLNGETMGYLTGNTTGELDLTDGMQPGENHLEIEVVGSPRNMFGPFHQTYTGCSRISWADFRTEGRFFTPDYVLEPYGLFGQIVISTR